MQSLRASVLRVDICPVDKAATQAAKSRDRRSGGGSLSLSAASRGAGSLPMAVCAIGSDNVVTGRVAAGAVSSNQTTRIR